MKLLISLFFLIFLTSCSQTIKLAVPTVFKEQATTLHVTGSKKNLMKFGVFSTSRIKRGIHVTYGEPGRMYFLENLFLNAVGLQKLDVIEKEKANFKFTLSDGKLTTEVIAREREISKSVAVRTIKQKGIFNEYQRLQEYSYIFSALINSNNTKWELLMSNIYERKKDTVNSLFTVIRLDDNGIATNGKDSIYIKGVTIKETEAPNGKKGVMPFKVLGGYELSTQDGVIAIVDIIGANVWFYKGLDAVERLTVAAIATAIFARRVNNSAW